MLPKLSVTRPYTVVVAVVLVLILGAVSFLNLQTDLLPSIDFPYLLIITSYPGASPEEVEMVVTKPIEQVVATINNIKNVQSISREGSSLVILEFNYDVNLDTAMLDINGKLEMIKNAWDDAVGSPLMLRINPDMLPVLIASVDVAGMDVREISSLAETELIPELESVNGVASVTAEGLLEETVEVVISQEKIDAINSRILEKVDAELAGAEAELQAAAGKISEGKAQLKAEEAKRNQELAAGEAALTAGLAQVEEALQKMAEGEPQLLQAKSELEEAVAALAAKEAELQTGIDALLAAGDDLSDAEQAQLAALKEQLAALGVQKAEAEAALSETNNRLAALQTEKEKLLAQQKELSQQLQQVRDGKKLLQAEMEKARAELAAGEAEIKKQQSSLEDARQEAFAQASLEGMITQEMISGILAAQNFAMPAGYLGEEGNEYLVKIGDKLAGLDELKGLLLFDTGPEGIGKIYLEDVAEIRRIDNAEDLYAKVNGNDAVILIFQKQSNFSTTAVTKNLREKMRELESSREGLTFTALMDQGVYIEIVLDSVLDNLIYGGLLAALILILFLRDIKPTIVIAVSIPISLVFALAMMYFSGVSMNVISLAGLALGVGMLVDNSIVVLENIYRMRTAEGKSALRAAVDGTNQVGGAIFASTLTTVCVFLPIVFTKGLTRELFTDMGLTIAYSLLASLIVAVTLVPTMAATVLKNQTEKKDSLYTRFVRLYESVLRWSLQHKAIVIAFFVVLFAVSCYLGTIMGTVFFPDMDTPQMTVTIAPEEGAGNADVTLLTEEVVERISGIPDIETIGAFRGGGMDSLLGMGSGKTASLYLVLAEQRTLSNKEIAQEIERLTAGLDCKVTVNTNNIDMSALGVSGLEVEIRGRELDTLQKIAFDVARIMEEVEGTTDIATAADDGAAEIRIRVNKEKAMAKGLTVAQVFSHVRSRLAQQQAATTLQEDNRDYPVIVVDDRTALLTPESVAGLTVVQETGGEEKEVRLDEIAEIETGTGLASIRRDAQQRMLSITAALEPGYNIGLVSRELEAKLADYEVPEGYSVKIAGEMEIINTSLRDLYFMLALAVVLVYLIMVAQFQSLLSPLIVMFTIPLAFTGGLIALYLTGYEISLVAMLGFLVLSGVVVNNGIVFVDYTNQLRDEGRALTEALVEAGKTRLRPILMTAITTILGLSTLSFGVGLGSEVLQPLAIVMIGGLLYATLLTLVVVPVMYELLHKRKIRRTLQEGIDF
ncbi:MAG: MMPL family transporter [Firmicutes bacterium]|nr:MMPL family transporter [Bacillota bacterium]